MQLKEVQQTETRRPRKRTCDQRVTKETNMQLCGEIGQTISRHSVGGATLYPSIAIVCFFKGKEHQEAFIILPLL